MKQCVYKPRNAKVGRAKEGSSLRDFVESLANILISDFWTSELKTINYCYFKPSKFVIIC